MEKDKPDIENLPAGEGQSGLVTSEQLGMPPTTEEVQSEPSKDE